MVVIRCSPHRSAQPTVQIATFVVSRLEAGMGVGRSVSSRASAKTAKQDSSLPSSLRAACLPAHLAQEGQDGSRDSSPR